MFYVPVRSVQSSDGISVGPANILGSGREKWGEGDTELCQAAA